MGIISPTYLSTFFHLQPRVSNFVSFCFPDLIRINGSAFPVGDGNFLTFVFSNSSFLAGRSGATGFDGYFRTRPGYAYVAEASYAEGIYNVALKEKKAGSKQLRELDFGECTPKSSQAKRGAHLRTAS